MSNSKFGAAYMRVRAELNKNVKHESMHLPQWQDLSPWERELLCAMYIVGAQDACDKLLEGLKR